MEEKTTEPINARLPPRLARGVSILEERGWTKTEIVKRGIDLLMKKERVSA